MGHTRISDGAVTEPQAGADRTRIISACRRWHGTSPQIKYITQGERRARPASCSPFTPRRGCRSPTSGIWLRISRSFRHSGRACPHIHPCRREPLRIEGGEAEMMRLLPHATTHCRLIRAVNAPSRSMQQSALPVGMSRPLERGLVSTTSDAASRRHRPRQAFFSVSRHYWPLASGLASRTVAVPGHGQSWCRASRARTRAGAPSSRRPPLAPCTRPRCVSSTPTPRPSRFRARA